MSTEPKSEVAKALVKFVEEMRTDLQFSYPRSSEWTGGSDWVMRRAILRLRDHLIMLDEPVDEIEITQLKIKVPK